MNQAGSTVNIKGGSSDGICLEEIIIDRNGAQEVMSERSWLDTNCESSNTCLCDEYEIEQNVLWNCETSQGESEVALILGNQEDITSIPENVVGLDITLESSVDIDLQLWIADDCLVGYGCTHPNEETFTFEGMSIFFSGDKTESPVQERIT